MRHYILLICCMVLGCASGSDDAIDSSRTSSGKADGTQSELAQSLASGYHFSLSSELEISLENSTEAATTYTLTLTGLVFPVVDEAIGQTTFTLRPCYVTLPDVDGRSAEIEASTVQNVSPFDVTVELENLGEQIKLRTSQGVLLAGVELSEPDTEALPESKNDGRLVDVDEDTHPGMSLLVDGWKVYTAMRIKMILEGAIAESGIIDGEGQLSIEFGMYGDNVPFVDAAAQAQEAIEQLRVDNQEHLFRFLPAESDQMNCEAVAGTSFSTVAATTE